MITLRKAKLNVKEGQFWESVMTGDKPDPYVLAVVEEKHFTRHLDSALSSTKVPHSFQAKTIKV